MVSLKESDAGLLHPVKREKINTMIEEKLDEIVSLAKQNGIKVDTLQEILNMLYYGEE